MNQGAVSGIRGLGYFDLLVGNIIGKYPIRPGFHYGLLFDTSNGLGLSIIRAIGSGDNPSHNHMGVGKMMDGFIVKMPSMTGQRCKGGLSMRQSSVFHQIGLLPKLSQILPY